MQLCVKETENIIFLLSLATIGILPPQKSIRDTWKGFINLIGLCGMLKRNDLFVGMQWFRIPNILFRSFLSLMPIKAIGVWMMKG